MKTILTPTDFSPNAVNAIAYAAQVAKKVRGKLILVHALPFPVASTPELPGGITPQKALREAYLRELEQLSKNLRLENGFAFDVECYCTQGPLFQSLGTMVEEHKVDMIVMGTKGASGFMQKLAGTNALTIMRQVNCPVLVVPATAQYTAWEKVAYASDFEKEEKVFLQQLFTVTAPFAPIIEVMNVQAEEQLNLVADHQIIKAMVQDQPVQIKQVKAASVLAGIKQYIQENQVQVLAVAIEKRTWLEALFHQSVSAQLAFASNLPILALPQTPYQTIAPQAVASKVVNVN
ncbi:universal stress protein [Nibribacter ruber]|uniref:Universal stress protein n=1 Tax=Nibribacter ruber TaxID=2698458 RepID=A0A6P1NYH3_9BACT|nr:universal stress protein [Nibribacter ruber]QHL86811.1 universal stress protein [Nibribacter ruber]